jgi:hypothetical protein
MSGAVISAKVEDSGLLRAQENYTALHLKPIRFDSAG